MDYNFVISLFLVVIILGIGFVFNLALNLNSKFREIVNVLTKHAPTLIDDVSDTIKELNPELIEKIDIIEKIALKAVEAVEKVSQSQNLSSSEKKQLAIQYFEDIADGLGLEELTSIQVKVLDVIIESIVLKL